MGDMVTFFGAGAGSTPLHYAACGGNLKCCQAKLINYVFGLHL